VKTDSELQHAVLAELEREPMVPASEIGVAAKNSVVTLSGFVEHHTARMAAERVAKHVAGVRAVANDIAVKLPGSSRRYDPEIAVEALTALRSAGTIPAERVTVTVRDGWLVLEGTLDSPSEKAMAERVVHRLDGVKGVTNQITVPE